MIARSTGISPQRQKPGQTRAAQRAAIGRVQPRNPDAFQCRGHIVHRLLDAGKIPRIFRLVAVKHHQKNVPCLRKQRNGLGKRPDRLRRAREKQQRLRMLLPVLQKLHGSHLRFVVKPL